SGCSGYKRGEENMNIVDDILHDVQAAGLILQIDPPDLIVRPADLLTPDLEARLKTHKTDVLRRLELEASIKRLEAAGITIAIWEDGSMRVLVTDSVQTIDAGGTIYSPRDMYHFVQLTEKERRMLHSFKKRFGGIPEWRNH